MSAAKPRPVPAVRVERERDAQGRPENARPRDRFGMPLPRGEVDRMAHKEEPDEVVSSIDEALDRAAQLFDEQRFFEAHEFLEWIWKHPDVDPADRDFWKGVTQVAVACCHTQRRNADGALTLLERGVGYMEGSPPQHLGVDRIALSTAALRLAEEVRAQGPHPDHDFPCFPRA